jgi:hypothetical protein
MAVAVVALTGAMAQAADKSPEAKYQALLADAKTAKGTVDWQALRFAYANQPSVNVMDDGLGDVRKSMMAAREADNFSELLHDAQRIIDKDLCRRFGASDGERGLCRSQATCRFRAGAGDRARIAEIDRDRRRPVRGQALHCYQCP